MNGNMHTGRYEIRYGDPTPYRGSISAGNGYVRKEIFGIDLDYSHTVLLNDMSADIEETGRIQWRNGLYEIKKVVSTFNVIAIAMKRIPTGTDGKQA